MAVAVAPVQQSSWWTRNQRKVIPYLYIAPFFVLFIVFGVWPIIYSFILSLYKGLGLGPKSFYGIGNYIYLFSDPRFLRSFWNTIFFALASVFVLSPLALLLALALQSVFVRFRLRGFYRLIYFLPVVTSQVIIAVLFFRVFDQKYGLLNQFLQTNPLTNGWTHDWLRDTALVVGFGWLTWTLAVNPTVVIALTVIGALIGLVLAVMSRTGSRGIAAIILSVIVGAIIGFLLGHIGDIIKAGTLVMTSIFLINIWTYIGINALYWTAGLNSISHELYEAASIDGAGRWASFWNITFPLLRPMTLFIVIQAITGSIGAFALPFLLTGGGPSDATLTMGLYLYQQGFSVANFGYANAIGYAMAFISLILSVINLLLFRESEETPKAA